MKYTQLILPVAAAIILAACGTPQVALDQAQHGVALIEGLTKELTRYDRNTKLAEARRLAAIKDNKASVSLNASQTQLTSGLMTDAGMTGPLATEALLHRAAGYYGRLVDQQEKDRIELAEKMSKLLQDVPSPADKLAAVQKAMAEMGTQLSPSERLAIVTTFISEVKAASDANGKAADAAAKTGS